MIIALLETGQIVEVENALLGCASVRNLGRESIGQSYVGGMGYIGTPFTTVQASELVAAVQVDPDNCRHLQDWLKAMETSDRMADNHHPDTAAAFAIEDRAKKTLEEFICVMHDIQAEQRAALATLQAMQPAV